MALVKALFFYNRITPRPITLWLSDTYMAPVIIGRVEEKEKRIIAGIKC